MRSRRSPSRETRSPVDGRRRGQRATEPAQQRGEGFGLGVQARPHQHEPSGHQGPAQRGGDHWSNPGRAVNRAGSRTLVMRLIHHSAPPHQAAMNASTTWPEGVP